MLEVWRFCGGWQPQALPVALAVYDVPDADLLIDQLLLLRDLIDRRAALERERA